ncbi:MAG: hypothetical protein L0216_12315 [Planctomycetales bacterium]|nr:hypothetical protein [Planctomycetales bacterium]
MRLAILAATTAAATLAAAAAAAHDWNGIALAKDGAVLVTDGEESRLYRVAAGGKVTTVVQWRDGAWDSHAHHVATDAEGNAYLTSG